MADRSAELARLIDRRTVLQAGAALAAAGPAMLRERMPSAVPRVVVDACRFVRWRGARQV